ncbi:sulfotransferase [Myxococcota bacterium]|nr:sulfotransferase [Myxococcota bacterium]
MLSAPARFVVGTGRCGSTLLSRMLSVNTRVLNVFELFSGIDQFFRFQEAPVGGAELAERLRQDHPMLTMVLKRGYDVPEVVYPFDQPGSRYRRSDPVPWALGIAIPRISEEPDGLFDEMLELVEARPSAPLAVHYQDVFDWLAERTGRECWIERSGSSIEYLGELKRLFPDARFVHIHRDGCEAALSMREYPVLRVAVAVMNGMLGEIEYSHEGLTELERSDGAAIDRLLETRPPIELYGKYWSDQIQNGYAAVAGLDPADFLEVRFEDLVTRPEAVLSEIDAFFGLPGRGDWIAEASALSRGMPTLRLPKLRGTERERLEEACRAAMSQLGRSV